MARRSSAARTDCITSAPNAAISASVSGAVSAAGMSSTSRSTGGWMTRTSRMEKKPHAMLLLRQM